MFGPLISISRGEGNARFDPPCRLPCPQCRLAFIALWTKRELSNTVKLSVFISVFVPILTCGYGHESWVMTERILTQVEAPKMGFLRWVHGGTKGRTEVRLRSGQETSLAPPHLNLRYFGSKCIALKKKLTILLQLFGAPTDSVPGALSPPYTSLVWHFVTKCAAVKFAEPWMSNHFS